MLGKYAQAKTINFPLIKRGVVDYATSSDYTFASGDVKVKIDEGASANATNSLTYEGEGVWSLALTSSEMTGARIVVTVVDSATKAVEDQCVVVETYGHASAEHAFDLDTASAAQTGDSYAIVNSGTHGNAAIKTQTAAIETDTQDIQSRLPAALTGDGNIKADALKANGAAIPTNFSALAITAGGIVDADLETIKGQSVVCSAGVTFAAYVGNATAHIAVDGSGHVTAGTVADKTGYSISGTTTTFDELQTAISTAHGAGSWATATGFATPQDISDLQTHGDSTWSTATGFSTHSAADVWAVATRVLTAGTNIVLAKGTGITGFNDIAATDIVSGGAITTSGGAVSNVTTVGSVTTKTGYKLASDGLDLIVPADPSAIPILGTASLVTWIGWFGAECVNEWNVTDSEAKLRNSADSADLATWSHSDDGTTLTSGEPT